MTHQIISALNRPVVSHLLKVFAIFVCLFVCFFPALSFLSCKGLICCIVLKSSFLIYAFTYRLLKFYRLVSAIESSQGSLVHPQLGVHLKLSKN